MLEIIDKNLETEDIWLNKYIPYYDYIHYLKNGKLNLNFSKMTLFDDVLEGWNYNNSNFTKAWLNNISFMKRVKNDGGTFEYGRGFVHYIEGERDSVKFEQEFKTHIVTLKNHHCSCWFTTTEFNTEQRYMYNIYGKSRAGLAILISIKWQEIISFLEKNVKTFTCGFIDYQKESNKNPLFRKHESYSHEKEFRIITKDFGDENYYEFLLDSDLKKHITCSEPPKGEVYNSIKESLNKKDELKYSNLPIQWKLDEIIELL